MIPVGDFVRRRSRPYVNWTLILVNFGVFIYMLTLDTKPDLVLAGLRTSQADRFLIDWGFEPACVANYLGFHTDVPPSSLDLICAPGARAPLQLISAMFLHAGWAHILGNMLFLWIFGDNVEDRMGHLRYLAFYFICGIAASSFQTFMAVDTLVPSVGASGAIAGVLGAYLVLYPTAMVEVVVLPLFFLPFALPAIVMIGIWFALQLISGLAEVAQHTTAGSGVAWWAHVGGFAAGVLLVWLFKRGDRPERASSYG